MRGCAARDATEMPAVCVESSQKGIGGSRPALRGLAPACRGHGTRDGDTERRDGDTERRDGDTERAGVSGTRSSRRRYGTERRRYGTRRRVGDAATHRIWTARRRTSLERSPIEPGTAAQRSLPGCAQLGTTQTGGTSSVCVLPICGDSLWGCAQRNRRAGKKEGARATVHAHARARTHTHLHRGRRRCKRRRPAG